MTELTEFQNFKCTGCTYQCRAIGGIGKDYWREVITCVCENKNALVEVTTKIYPDVNQGILDIIEKEYNQCPYCHDQKYHPWPANHPCPKCGSKMITEAEMEAEKELEQTPNYEPYKGPKEDNKTEKENLNNKNELLRAKEAYRKSVNRRGLSVAITFQERDSERYEVYLINDSDTYYSSVEKTIGGYISQDDDPPVQMDSATNSLGELRPHSFLHIESGSLWNLDFHLWTHFLFTPKKGKKFKLWYEIGGTFYYNQATERESLVPILGKVAATHDLRELE